jgi:hypothetical protein
MLQQKQNARKDALRKRQKESQTLMHPTAFSSNYVLHTLLFISWRPKMVAKILFVSILEKPEKKKGMWHSSDTATVTVFKNITTSK